MGADTSRPAVLTAAVQTASPNNPRQITTALDARGPAAAMAPTLAAAIAPELAATLARTIAENLARKSKSDLPWPEFFTRLQAGTAVRAAKSAARKPAALRDSIA
jgi:hypothetical protein